MVLALLLAAVLHGPADVATLTAGADVVVRARVTSIESGWSGGDARTGVMSTTVVLTPLETLKGAAGARVVVHVPGGVAGEWEQTVSGTPKFTAGEEVVVFLRALALRPRGESFYEVERWSLGKFTVSQGRAVRDRSGVECVGCSREVDTFSLGELRGRVREAAK